MGWFSSYEIKKFHFLDSYEFHRNEMQDEDDEIYCNHVLPLKSANQILLKRIQFFSTFS